MFKDHKIMNLLRYVFSHIAASNIPLTTQKWIEGHAMICIMHPRPPGRSIAIDS